MNHCAPISKLGNRKSLGPLEGLYIPPHYQPPLTRPDVIIIYHSFTFFILSPICNKNIFLSNIFFSCWM